MDRGRTERCRDGSVDAVASLLLEAGLTLVMHRDVKVDSMLFVVGGGLVRLVSPSGDMLYEELLADLPEWAELAVNAGCAALLYVAGGLAATDEDNPITAAALGAVADGNLIGGRIPVLLAVEDGCR